jgi:capsular polysaccharide transport system permease protein
VAIVVLFALFAEESHLEATESTAPAVLRGNLATAKATRPLSGLFTRRHWVFHLTVLVPTSLAILYYSLIASDVYISESRFVVRSPERPAQVSMLDAVLQGTGISRSQDDVYSVHDFIVSRDALHELDNTLGVRKAYTSHDIDLFNRFAGLGWDDSFEALYRYYVQHIAGVDYDPSSSICTLIVRAYSAKDAHDINDLLVRMSERLVNSLNERSRHDLIDVAAREMQTAEERTKEATVALNTFRDKLALFEPDRQSMLQLTGVARLEEQLIATESQINQVQRVSPANPQLASLNGQADLLRKAIVDATAKVVGGKGSLSSKAPNFERLALEKEFAEKELAAAAISLEAARNQMRRQHLYLDRIVQPNLPDYPIEPRRIRSVAMVFVLGMILWGVLSLVVASIREHVD